ncbi:hypothetical protein, partial [Waltera sp.]|uniref:hypothetical protein n=1 Tax=Waltera sp. TaxID=2815806 RepID=UPI003AEFA7D9
ISDQRGAARDFVRISPTATESIQGGTVSFAIKNIGQYYTGLYYIRRNSQKYSGEPVQNRKKELYLKKYNFLKKSLAMPVNSMYTNPCCGMIAVKREVAGSQ